MARLAEGMLRRRREFQGVEAIKGEIIRCVFELLFVSRDMDRVNAYLAENLERIAPYSAYCVLMAQDDPPTLSIYPHLEIGNGFLREIQERVFASLARLGGNVHAADVDVRVFNPDRVSRRRRARIRSFVNIPIFQKDALFGLISIGSTEKDVYVRTDLSFFSNIAELLGSTYATLHSEVARRESELARLREMDRLKDKFLSAVSHELRSPLTVLSGLLEILREGQVGPVNAQQQEFLGSALEQATRLRWLMENLLDLSKIEYGTLDLSRGPARLDQLVDRAVRSLRYEIERKGILIEVSADLKALPAVCVDPNRVTQVIVNLIDNAAKYTPSGGGMRVTARSLQPAQPLVELAVADTGRGIAAEDQEHVFDRFYRLGREIRGAAGTGLGLSIAKEIVETHHGHIWVDSEEGQGSTFYFTLPIYQADTSLHTYLEQIVAHAREIHMPLTFILVAIDGHLSDDAEEIVNAVLRSSESVFHYAAGRGALVLGSFTDLEDARRMADRLEARLQEHLVRPDRPVAQVRSCCLAVNPGQMAARRPAAQDVDPTLERVVDAVHEMAGPTLAVEAAAVSPAPRGRGARSSVGRETRHGA